MKALSIAKQEYNGLIVKRHVWLFGAGIVLLVTLRTLTTKTALQEPLGPIYVIAPFQSLVYFLGGLTACILSYRAVVGERESGRLKLLLGFSATRYDITLGKYIGRATVLIVMFVVPITFGSIIGFLVAGDSAPLQLGLFITTAVLYLVAFAGIGLGISMIVSTSVRATALTFGSFFGFFLFWDIIINTIFTLINIPSDSPLFFVALRLSPQNAFQALSNIVLGIGNAVGPYYTVYRVTQEGMRTNLYIAPTTLDTMPIYLHGGVSVLALVGWAVVPLVAGQLVFTHRDL